MTMNLDTDTPAGLRRAALALHALGTADRDWLLQRLATPQQQALATLLAELQELGIPPDAGVIRTALSEAAEAPALPRDEALALCLALERESPSLQSLLLAALEPAQSEAVLAHWQTEFHARPSRVAAPAWTPLLREAVLESWRETANGVTK